jgi:hypothetical protein
MLDYFPHMSVFHQERTGFDHHWTRILCIYSAGVCPFHLVASFKFGNHKRFVFVDFVLLSLVSFYFFFISLISCRFVFVDFVSFRFVFADFVSFRFVSFLFRFALYRCPIFRRFFKKLITSAVETSKHHRSACNIWTFFRRFLRNLTPSQSCTKTKTLTVFVFY